MARRAIDYGIAVASIAVAVGVTLLLWGVFSRNPFALFYAAVMVSAWRGGFGPGLLASVFAVVAIDFFLMPSFFTGSLRDIVQASTFVGIAALLSWLNLSRDRAMASLRIAKQEADDANAAKDQFLAVLSHELRTPLTPVLGMAMMLESDPDLSAERRADATMIRRNVELEARLIDDLLDITRIRQGKLSLSRSPVDLAVLLRDVERICEADAQAKQIRVRSIVPAGTRMVHADPARLQQILWNLLKNAIKFTPTSGQVTINLSDGPKGVLKVDVMDTGIGIAPETLPRVFNAFEQGGSNVTRRFGGIGLGLAISKALAEAHGGQLVATSEGSGRGACFTLSLASLSSHTPSDAAWQPKGPQTEPLKVLLVEDHPDTSEVMTRLLQNLNHEVSHAGSITAARRLAGTRAFDVVISDIGLPDGTGVELMRHLSTEHHLKGIAMSGYGMEDDVRRSLDAGFHAHLTKPVNVDQLEAAIGELVAYSRSA
ncbi:MAG: Sensory transduction protein kinase 2 [Phycisphaerales bacterium]|nr:Sensory transduction protein kinase 2 [Phycisphaerales bacterium]